MITTNPRAAIVAMAALFKFMTNYPDHRFIQGDLMYFPGDSVMYFLIWGMDSLNERIMDSFAEVIQIPPGEVL